MANSSTISGTQVLKEIVSSYARRGVRVFFCRVPSRSSEVYTLFEKSGIVEIVGGHEHFLRSVDEALRLAEVAQDEDADVTDDALVV